MVSNVAWRWINGVVALACSVGIVIVFAWINSAKNARDEKIQSDQKAKIKKIEGDVEFIKELLESNPDQKKPTE